MEREQIDRVNYDCSIAWSAVAILSSITSQRTFRFLLYFHKFPSFYIRFPTLLLDSENARNSNQTVIIFPLFASGRRTENVKRKRAKSVFRRIPLAVVYPPRFVSTEGKYLTFPLPFYRYFTPFLLTILTIYDLVH